MQVRKRREQWEMSEDLNFKVASSYVGLIIPVRTKVQGYFGLVPF